MLAEQDRVRLDLTLGNVSPVSLNKSNCSDYRPRRRGSDSVFVRPPTEDRLDDEFCGVFLV